MSGKPAARLGDPTACPKSGHGNNPIISGSADVIIDGQPAAREGDTTGCGSALAGNLVANVLINGKPAATVDSLGDHGNPVVAGAGSVVIGRSHTPAPFNAPRALTVTPAALAPASPATPLRPLATDARSGRETFGDLAPDEQDEKWAEESLHVRQTVALRIGVFFDGTGNNAGNSAIGARCRASKVGVEQDEAQAIAQRCEAYHLDPESSYANDVSNIWRLYELYRDEPTPADANRPGILRLYISGIGTVTGKADSLVPGQAFGRGATGVLAKVAEGLTMLVQAVDSFMALNPTAELAGLEFDIFGFSRGAAAARHFANRLLERERGPLAQLRRSGRLNAGFDWRRDMVINFIGLFDTVAALGGWDDLGDPSDAINGGIDLYLKPDAARTVIHLVARDEHRLNFSLNRVASPHREIVLPGAHSDLGGGYPPEARERLYLARPRSSWVRLDTDPFRTPAYREAQRDAERLRQADLLDPRDEEAWLGVDVWERFSPFGRWDEQMKQVLAAPYVKRRVHGHLSRVYLRVMHALAVEAGALFGFIDEHDPQLALPAELVPVKDKLLAWAMSGSGSLSEAEERLLRQRYIHLSANWNAAVGRGGGLLEVVFINAPAEHGRVRHDDEPSEQYP